MKKTTLKTLDKCYGCMMRAQNDLLQAIVILENSDDDYYLEFFSSRREVLKMRYNYFSNASIDSHFDFFQNVESDIQTLTKIQIEILREWRELKKEYSNSNLAPFNGYIQAASSNIAKAISALLLELSR